MLHAKPLPTSARFSENDQPLSGQNHFLDVVKIEPAQNERLAEGMGIVFLQGGLEDPFPAPKVIEACLNHFAAETDGLVTFFMRKNRRTRSDLRSAADNA
jgi:hypothetical protein